MMDYAAMKRMAYQASAAVGESADHRNCAAGARGRSSPGGPAPRSPPRYYVGGGRVENTAHSYTYIPEFESPWPMGSENFLREFRGFDLPGQKRAFGEAAISGDPIRSVVLGTCAGGESTAGDTFLI
jgi:hypothetical protein